MYSERLLDLFQNPRNVGELEPPAIVVEVSNPACGDILRFSVRLGGNVVEEARFRTRGCAAAIAAGSALTELVKGKTLEELARLKSADIEQAVGGLSPESRHAAALCLEAVRGVLKAV